MSTSRISRHLRVTVRAKPGAVFNRLPLLQCYTTQAPSTAKPAGHTAGDSSSGQVNEFGFWKGHGEQPVLLTYPTRKIPDFVFWPRPSRKMPTVTQSFAVYAPAPRSRLKYCPKDPVPVLNKQLMKRYDPSGIRQKMFGRREPDRVMPGDILRVRSTRGEQFSGVLMSLKHRGPVTSILLRNKVMGTAIEQSFKVFSPQIASIEILLRRQKKYRRLRLTYLRKPRHDIGNVEEYIARIKRDPRFQAGATKAQRVKQTKVKKKVSIAKVASRNP